MAAALGLALAAAQGMANSYKPEDTATEVDSAYVNDLTSSAVRTWRSAAHEQQISFLRGR